MSQSPAEKFWRSQLEDFGGTTFPALPSDSYAPVATKTLKQQKNLSIRYSGSLTFSQVLRLSWALAVSKFSSTTDVCFGATVTGRAAFMPGVDLITGPTVATVPIRIRLSALQPLQEALDDLQVQATEMIAFEQTGLQTIRKWCPEGCQFQTLLVLQTQGKDELPYLFVEGKSEDNEALARFSSCAITLVCSVEGTNMTVEAAFDESIVPEFLMERLMHLFTHITSQIVDGSPRRLKDVDMLSHHDIAALTK